MTTNKPIKISLFVTIAVLIYSCNTSPAPQQNDAGNTVDSAGIDMHKDVITGRIQQTSIAYMVKAEGKTAVPPRHKASVHPPMGGFVKEIWGHTGQFVAKGTVLARLEHPSYIVLQQEYLKARHELAFHNADLTRQGQLTIEHASSVKKMEQAQVEYRTTEVNYLALKAQLKLLGLEPDSVHEDNLTPVIALKAPISGHITSVYATIGRFVPDHEPLYELTSRKHMHIRLQIDAIHSEVLKKGLPVQFHRTHDSLMQYHALVESVNQQVDEETGYIEVYARLTEQYPALLPGISVKAKITVHSAPVHVLPAKAVIQENNDTYAFVSNNGRYNKVKLNAGRAGKDYIELLHVPDSLLSYEFAVENIDRIKEKR